MPKLILSYRLWEENGQTLFQVTGMDEAFRGKGELFMSKKNVRSIDNPEIGSFSIFLRGDDFHKDNDSVPVNRISRKRIIKTLNAWARSLNPAIQKETNFAKTEFAYYYAEDDKPKCHWCGSEMKIMFDGLMYYLRCPKDIK